MNIRTEWMTNNELFGDDYEKKILLDNIKERFDIQRNESLEGYEVTVISDYANNISSTEQWVIQNYTNILNEPRVDKKALAPIDSIIQTGYYITHKNKPWIAISSVESNEAYLSTKITECNRILTFQTNDQIFTYPCVLKDKSSTYSDGTQQNQYIALAEDQILIIITADNNTNALKLNNRFIFNHDKDCVYKLTKKQSLLQDGLLYLTMTLHDYNETTDNLELNIADYTPHNYSIEILNGSSAELAYLDTLQLSIRVTDNGIITTEYPDILFVSSNETICTVDENGIVTAVSKDLTATITATLDGYEDTFDSIAITTKQDSSDRHYTYELNVDIDPYDEILYGQTKVYTLKKFDSTGVEVDGIFDITIVNTGIPSSAYQLTVLSDNSCSIKAQEYIYDITLRFNDIDTLLYRDYTIKLKSIL